MKLTIDFEHGTVSADDSKGPRTLALGSAEGFALVSKAWIRAGWDAKYVYSFTWLGRPIIQLPEDMFRIQEIIHRLQPDVIIETGVAHGGSLIFYATLFEAMGRGQVIGVDVEIRPHNRKAIEEHALARRVTLVEGDSKSMETLARVRSRLAPSDRVMVLLDSNHRKDHVLGELESYGPLVTAGSYIVAMDGIMAEVAGAPRTQPDWVHDNPIAAVEAFLEGHPEFVLDEPAFAFNEGAVRNRVTYWPSAFLRHL
jgi:cephalosporin hydroxylase